MYPAHDNYKKSRCWDDQLLISSSGVILTRQAEESISIQPFWPISGSLRSVRESTIGPSTNSSVSSAKDVTLYTLLRHTKQVNSV